MVRYRRNLAAGGTFFFTVALADRTSSALIDHVDALRTALQLTRRSCHTIRDDRDFERQVDYIHFNPVKDGLVSRVADWRCSSFHRYVRDGILPQDWAGDLHQDQERFGEPR